MTLHIVSKAPEQNSALNSCYRVAQPNDPILLIEDGVYALLSHLSESPTTQLFALKADVDARGLGSRAPASVQLIDDDGFVALTEQESNIQSWY